MSTGTGRDNFQGDRPPPATGKQFDKYKAPSGSLPPKPSKGFHYPTGMRAGYVPNGTGRDLQLFVDKGHAVPATGFQYSAKPPHVKRYQQPIPASRSEPPTRTRPNGTGRDLFQIATGGPRTIPQTSIIFSDVAPTPKDGGLAPRTSPPPRYTPSGSGRDTFQSVEKGGPVNDPADAFGFGPPRWDPASLHRPSSVHMRKTQRARMESLSRPRTTGTQATGGFGLLVPGSNLRR